MNWFINWLEEILDFSGGVIRLVAMALGFVGLFTNHYDHAAAWFSLACLLGINLTRTQK